MKHTSSIFSATLIACSVFISLDTDKEVQARQQQVIFAVINDGKMIEPIARVIDGKFVQAYGAGENGMEMPAFAAMYYQPQTTYQLITGGKPSGKATVIKNDPSWECTSNMAEVTVASPKQRLRGFEMALAANFTPAKPSSGIRRAATAAEKAMADKLAIATFKKNNTVVKNLKAVKLTVLDIDNDKQPELVATYTVSPEAGERGLLFFIAGKNSSGAMEIQFSEYNHINKDEVMSGEIEPVDSGIYQELLLDVLDADNNGVAEIFTMRESFEGAGFIIYQRNGKTWERVMDVSNYHCAY